MQDIAPGGAHINICSFFYKDGAPVELIDRLEFLSKKIYPGFSGG
ncbi:MAG: hypothetical protein ACOZCO_13115 [Bacteroidota bacterium]